ncbi:MAG: HU family DNA-binding protein [Sphingobacteriia bacterium]|jgi:DNA-binding protein HU-beta|nr:HU family DNA-binding protein [Paludibacteraceae bacterium]NCA78583.1 HU family DNA-binding protein [Sphingobacteriia bacterium]
MNYKEFISELAQSTDLSQKETMRYVTAFVEELTSNILEGDQVAFLGLGTFEVRRKELRVSVSPTTKEKIVIPAKQVVAFKPSINLKDKLKPISKS